ncbi:MAG: hypothetical protein HY314_00480 [Acidobacteria bacterium]|nr:hypothetical protein [Acidobacteriota bacterium]
MRSAAKQLKGKKLDSGWTVGDPIDLSETTGGYFSVSYYVKHENGTRAFLKAFDYAKALRSADPAVEVKKLADAFLFERMLVEKCKERRMDRVVRGITSGKIV